jgi:hypothetical protein
MLRIRPTLKLHTVDPITTPSLNWTTLPNSPLPYLTPNNSSMDSVLPFTEDIPTSRYSHRAKSNSTIMQKMNHLQCLQSSRNPPNGSASCYTQPARPTASISAKSVLRNFLARKYRADLCASPTNKNTTKKTPMQCMFKPPKMMWKKSKH